jgi:transcriptional regulator with XRE-family HTH domain
MVTVGRWTGAKARILRRALRMSGDEFAGRLGTAARTVAKWENELLDKTLALASHRDLDHVLETADPQVQARFAELLQEEVQPRSATPAVFAMEAASAQKMVIPANVALGGAMSPTSETLDWLDQTLRSQYAADNRLGPRLLMPLMTSYVTSIEEMQRGARGSVLERLLRIGAGYAEFTGWLHHDAGDLREARLWVTRALEWAEGGGDDRMTSFIMMRRAAAALTAREGGYAVKFAQRAQRFDSAETGRVRIIAAVTEAHGHAITGDGSGADRALDAAASLLERYDSEIFEGDPTADRYCELGLYTKIATAKCALELGRGVPAVDAFTDVIDSLPADFHRDRGQYLSSLARAHTLAEQPEAAIAAGREAYGIAIATGSARTLTTLRSTLPSELAPWSHIPEVQQFCAMLAAVDS